MKAVIFDTECLLCNRFIRLLLRLDKEGKLKFASPSSDFAAAEILRGIDFSKTIVFYSDGSVFLKSKAIKEILKEVSAFGFLIFCLNRLPASTQDWLYDLAASNRYFFGRKQSCAINSKSPSEQQIKSRLLS